MPHLEALAPATVGVRNGDSPALAEGEVRVAVAYTGVCHSDLAAVAEGGLDFPARLGHEVSGVVTESRSDRFAPGDRVAAYVSDGYATETITAAERLVALHPDCSLLDGALAEPLACVLGGLEMVSFREADRVVLVGAGFMGLLALRSLVTVGHRVLVVEPRPLARDLALAWGADAALAPDEVPGDLRLSESRVIEASGAAAGLALAEDLVAIDGTLGVLGYHQAGGGTRTVHMADWNFRAMTVVSMHNRSLTGILRWMDRAQRSSALGFIRPGELVDAVVGLDELPDVFGHGAGGAVKTVLRGDAAGA